MHGTMNLKFESSALRPDRFSPRERVSGMHCLGGWVGIRTGIRTLTEKLI